MEPARDPEAPDAEATRLRPGAQLLAARQRAGFDEPRAAAEMRIDLATLRALEADDYAALGAPIFVKGHLRNYARLLGLDGERLVTEYEAAAVPSAPRLFGYRNEGDSVDRTPLRQHVPLVSWSIALLIAIGFGWWAWNNPLAIKAPEPVPVETPASVETTEAPAAVPLAEPPVDAGTGVIPPSGDSPLPASDASAAGVAAPVAAARTESQRVEPVGRTDPAPAPPRAVAPDGALRVQLRFSAESWVEIYAADGAPLVYELFDAGRARSVTAKPPLRVFIGQAAAVAVTVDGRRLELGELVKRDGTARFTLAAGGELR